jgi:hypothetical protein
MIDIAKTFFLLSFVLFAVGCEVPNLEAPECTASRDTVKKFYSFHFGSEMASSPEIVKEREKFLTPELAAKLAAAADSKTDYFTATDKYPRAFRVGECTANSKQNTTFRVILLWRDDTRSEQREVNVEAVEMDGKWLINRVFS